MNFEAKHIDELLIAYLLQELDTEKMAQVEAWIQASEENKQQFETIKQVWHHVGDTTGNGTENGIGNTIGNSSDESANDIVFPKFNSEKAWDKVSVQLDPVSNSKPVISRRFIISIAASLLLLVGSFIVFQNLNQDIPTTVLYAKQTITNDTLTDGSFIKLNQNSSLSFSENFNEDIREVRLKGEAFFDIKRDTTKAFIIHIDRSRVEVLGTSFNIKSKGAYTDVYVKSGLVKFEYLAEDTTKAYESILLKAGEKVRYNKITRKIIESKDSLLNQAETYWIDKKLSFDGIKLKKVIEILEVVYDVKIEAADRTINNCLLTVSFDNEDIDQIMAVIASTFKLEIEKDKNHYFLNGPSCESE